MSNKMPYAGWVAMTLRDNGDQDNQEARAKYWTDSGKVEFYDQYVAFCKQEKKKHDPPPEGYWESKEKPWHKPTGILMGLTGILVWVTSGIIGGSTGQVRK